MTTTATATSDTWTAHYADRAGYRFWPNEELVRAVGQRRFGTVVEAGCGNGANLWFLAERAASVTGVDLSELALASAATYMRERRVADRVRLMQAHVADMPLDAGDADAVVDVMTGQHVPWPARGALYREYRRVLRPGGWLFCYGLAPGSTTDGASEVCRWTYRDLPALFPGVGPVCLPPDFAVVAELDAAGFAVTSVRRTALTYADGRVAAYAAIEATAGGGS